MTVGRARGRPTPRASRAWGAAIVLAVTSVLSGCLGDDDAPEPPMPGDGMDLLGAPDGIATPFLALPDSPLSIAPWAQDLGDVHAEPSDTRLIQYALEHTEKGVLRLFGDGAAFWLLIDEDDAPEGSVVFARIIDVRNDVTAARGVAAYAEPADNTHFVMPLPGFDPIRMNAAYAIEVAWFLPYEPVFAPSEDGTRIEPTKQGAFQWNGTLYRYWDGPLSLRPLFEIAFEGPTDGVDRPDVLEHPAFGGPPSGVYTVTLKGARLWLVDLLVETGASVVMGTAPEANANGTTNVHVQVDGYHPLAYWKLTPRGQGLDQSFALEITVDYETVEEVPDVPVDSDQIFFATAAGAYRVGKETFVADTAGAHVPVHVAAEFTP